MTTQREQKEVEAIARDIAKHIADALPHGLGFAFLVFDFGEGGTLAYMSNAKRDDMLRALHELIGNLEKSP